MTADIRLFLHRLPEPVVEDQEPAHGVAPEELARAQRFHFARDRRRWLGGRAWIRRTLGTVLGQPPTALTFRLGTNGKPQVVGAPPAFDCNWSHSGDRIALAVSDSSPIGVDLELVRDGFAVLEVAKQFFTPLETRALEQAEGPARPKLFLRLWTAKEALMKATGAGVWLPPDQIEVILVGSIPTAYATHPEWQIASREADQWAAAVAWPARVHGRIAVIAT